MSARRSVWASRARRASLVGAALSAMLVRTALLEAQPAEAQPAEAQPAGDAADGESQAAVVTPGAAGLQPDPCDLGEFRLDGADTRSGDEAEVSYRAEWSGVLESVAACVASASEPVCARVQGQFDDVPFDPRFAAIYGSQEAAQLARARARASMAVAKLQQLGVPADRVVHLPPDGPGYRGVRVVLSTECGLRAPTGEAASSDANGGAQEGALTEVALDEAALARAIRAGEPAPQPLLRWFVDIGAAAFLNAVDESLADGPAFGGGVALRGGFEGPSFFARVDLGAMVGDRDDRRLVAKAGAAAGYRAGGFQLGVGGDYARLGQELLIHTLNQAWSLGVDATYCFALEGAGLDDSAGGALCPSIYFAPFGQFITRSTVQSGQVVTTPERSLDTVKLEVLVSYRFR